MLFSDSIPEKVKSYPNVTAFMDVLDELQNFKTEIIADSLRVDNSAVLMDRKWLLKKLAEYGVTDIPLNYPIQIIRQYLLNVDTICRTRGSKIGLELYVSLLSLGEVTIDDSYFYKDSNVLLLDSVSNGFITENSSSNKFYLMDDNNDLNKKSSLRIIIKSKFFNGQYPDEAKLIKNYIISSLKRNLGFSNYLLTLQYIKNSEFYFHKLLNPYFV